MKTIRWLLFLPVTVIAALATGFGIAELFPARSYLPGHLILSIVHPRGLAGYIVSRFAAVLVFVLLGSLLAPGSGRKVVITLGIIAAFFSLPLPDWPGADVLPFFLASLAGTAMGCAAGMLLAFQLRKRRSSRHGQHHSSAVAELKR